MTTALAPRTRPRLGLAARVTLSRPRRYSAVMNMAATMIAAISAPNTPIRFSSMEAPLPPAAGTSGAMSPDPLTLSDLPANWNPGTWWTPGPPLAEPRLPISVPVHDPPGCSGPKVTWSNTAVASALLPFALDPVIDWEVTRGRLRAAVNNPAGTVAGSPARRVLPTSFQCEPSADS